MNSGAAFGSSALILALAIAFACALWWQWQAARRTALRRGPDLFQEVLPLLAESKIVPGEAAGTWRLTGTYKGRAVQLMVVTDLLAARKLPSLWLLITRPTLLPITQRLDLMMRPSGPTSFSNFDFLPHSLATPADYPPHAVIRSDAADSPVPLPLLAPFLGLFHGGKGKELLITPQGLRIVVLLGEANRARYGVFRQADFGDVRVEAELATSALDTLLALEDRVHDYLRDSAHG